MRQSAADMRTSLTDGTPCRPGKHAAHVWHKQPWIGGHALPSLCRDPISMASWGQSHTDGYNHCEASPGHNESCNWTAADCRAPGSLQAVQSPSAHSADQILTRLTNTTRNPGLADSPFAPHAGNTVQGQWPHRVLKLHEANQGLGCLACLAKPLAALQAVHSPSAHHADQVRTRLTNATRNPGLANRLVPRLPGEVPSIYRARLLLDTIMQQLSSQQSSALQSQVLPLLSRDM